MASLLMPICSQWKKKTCSHDFRSIKSNQELIVDTVFTKQRMSYLYLVPCSINPKVGFKICQQAVLKSRWLWRLDNNAVPHGQQSWRMKDYTYTVFVFVVCLHNPYSPSSRSADEKLSSAFCRKPVFSLKLHTVAQRAHRCSTFTVHWAGTRSPTGSEI